MAATITVLFRDFRRGGRKFVVAEVRLDNAYPGYPGPASGYPVNAVADLGFDTQMDAAAVISEDSYINLGWDQTQKRIVAYAPHTSAGTGGFQLNSGSTALSNARCLLLAWGS